MSHGPKLIAAIRDYQSGNWLQRKLAVLRHHFWSAVCAADIPINACIGPNLLMPHPCGVVIHPRAVIGPDCLLQSSVVIGQSTYGSGVPMLGRHVDVGSGAKILGGVLIGDHVLVGANAIVLADVPSGTTVVGVWK